MSATSGFFVIVCKHWRITNTSDEFRTHLDQLKVSLNISVILSVLVNGQKVTGLKITKLLRQKVTIYMFYPGGQKVTIYMFYPGGQKVTIYMFYPGGQKVTTYIYFCLTCM